MGHEDVCKECALGKYTKNFFPRNDNKTTSILDLVNSDICVLMYPIYLSGYVYYVIFIDEFSRKT